MHIPCESCGTTYDLDPQLLPPGGAPVQCTRCGHVFVAYPQAPEAPSGREAPAEQPRRSTSEFALPTLPGEPLPPERDELSGTSSGQTFMFSVPREVFADDEPAAAPIEQRPSTQMFAATDSAQRPSTQMFAATDSAQRPSTQMFAATDSAQRPSTQMFAATDNAQRPSTQMFAATDSAQRPSTQMYAATPDNAPSSAASAPRSTVPMFVPSPEPRPSTQMFGAPSDQAIVATAPGAFGQAAISLPEEAPGQRAMTRPFGAASVRLPAEPLPLGFDVDAGSHAVDRSAENRRRNATIAVGVVLLLALIIGAVLLGPRIFPDRSLPSPEAVAARVELMRLIRKDDAHSRTEAALKLDELLVTSPHFVEARANRVLLSAFEVDEVRAHVRRLEARDQLLVHQSSNLRTSRKPSDWENRVNAIDDERKRIAVAITGFTAKADALESTLVRDVANLSPKGREPTAEEARAIAAAEALTFAVGGDQSALASAERYRLQGGTGGWDVIARATYAVHAPTMAPVTVQEIRDELQTLQAADPGFLRAFILSARLALLQKDPAAARAVLENASTFNPKHEAVKQLSTWAAELETR